MRTVLRLLVFAALLVLPAGCWILVWGTVSRPQNVDLAPLDDLTLRTGIRSLKAAFPDAAGHVSGGYDSWTRSPRMDGMLEHLWFRDGRCTVTIETYVRAFNARHAYNRKPREVWKQSYRPPDDNRYSGEGDERACVSPVRENRVGEYYLGDFRSGTYASFVLVQKGNVLILVEEETDTPTPKKLAKDGVIREIAEALRPHSD